MDPEVKHLLSLRAIRERAKIVGEAAKSGELNHFEVDDEGLNEAADFVISVIERDFGPDKYDTIPPHGRWQHFEVGSVPRIGNLLELWSAAGCDKVELTRRLIDLFFVSVLLDAGAGDYWHYIESETGHKYERSEGIAVASLHMFNSFMYTSRKDEGIPLVDGKGLEELKTETLAAGFQSSENNPMLGVDSRAVLLRSLGQSLLAHTDIFGVEGRPGNLVDYMIKSAGESEVLDVFVIWDVLQTLLIPCWPNDRVKVGGHPVGDAWQLKVLETKNSRADSAGSEIQPFHKLTQWLTYSLMVPFTRVLNLSWKNTESLTALAEYRNGGLFIDFGALRLKEDDLDRGLKASGQELPLFDADDDVIVEWRAMTVVLLDKIYDIILSRMKGNVRLTMAQVLEAGTWKSGREIAAKRRPVTKSSPILIRTDGTVF